MLPILLAAAMLPSINFHPDGAPEYALDGTIRSRAGRALPVTLWIGCRGPRALGLQLEIAARRTDFDFADFVEPAADAGERRLTRLSWISSEHVASITSAATAARPGSDGAFHVFNVDGTMVPPGPLLALLLTIDDSGGELAWTQTAIHDSDETFSATFAVTGPDGENVRRQIASCFDPPLGM